MQPHKVRQFKIITFEHVFSIVQREVLVVRLLSSHELYLSIEKNTVQDTKSVFVSFEEN